MALNEFNVFVITVIGRISNDLSASVLVTADVSIVKCATLFSAATIIYIYVYQLFED